MQAAWPQLRRQFLFGARIAQGNADQISSMVIADEAGDALARSTQNRAVSHVKCDETSARMS
jgi:hypothetical protein